MTEAFSTTCAVHIKYFEGCELSGCRGKALAAQARGVLGSTPDDCRPFHFTNKARV